MREIYERNTRPNNAIQLMAAPIRPTCCSSPLVTMRHCDSCGVLLSEPIIQKGQWIADALKAKLLKLPMQGQIKPICLDRLEALPVAEVCQA